MGFLSKSTFFTQVNKKSNNNNNNRHKIVNNDSVFRETCTWEMQNVCKKVKQSRYRPGVDQRVPGSQVSQIS